MAKVPIQVVERLLRKTQAFHQAAGEMATGRIVTSGHWSAFSDACGLWLRHWGTCIACLTPDGELHVTATSASDRDGVNTFSWMVNGCGYAVGFEKFVPTKKSWCPDGVFVYDRPSEVVEAAQKAYSERVKREGGRAVFI